MDQPTFDPTHRANRAAAHRVGAGAVRRVGLSARLAALPARLAALPARLSDLSARLSDLSARQPALSMRLARLVLGSALCLPAGALLLPLAVHAQEAGGPIVIAGPGETNPAALADLAEKMQAAPAKRVGSAATLAAATAQSWAPGPASRDTDQFTRAANASGAIVIAGVDEPSAAPQMVRTSFKPDANGVVTIPAPGSVNSGAAGQTTGFIRVNVAPASRQVVPVVITPAPQPNGGRQATGVQPVAANAPGNGVSRGFNSGNGSGSSAVDSSANNIASAAPASGVFDSLASRGEPPQLDAHGNPIATRPTTGRSTATRAAAAPIAVSATTSTSTAAPAPGPATIARTSAIRPIAPAVAQQNLRAAAVAQPAPLTGQQDADAIRSTALAFLKQQSAGLPGQVEITVAPAFPRGLAACTTLEPFMPSGARLWGRMTVGVRCAGERPWTIYLQARIALHATYYLAARAMAPGEVLGAADLVARDGDLTGLPQAVITDPSQAIGSVTLTRVAGGMPLRRDMLKSASAVSIGQTVRVVAAGAGFAISAEGSAMNNASPGQQVRVRTANGQIVSGIVKDGATVEIQL